MMAGGFVLPALSIGLGSIHIRPTRGIQPGPGSPAAIARGLIAHATLEEMHRDELDISDHPVEQGAQISDHAFKRAAEVVVRCAWSNSPPGSPGLLGAALGAASAAFPIVGKVAGAIQTVRAAQSMLSGNANDQVKAIYQSLLELQNSRIPFDLYTGKRAYKSMMLKSLSVTTEKETENILDVTLVCRQIIIVTTQTVKLPVNAAAQGQPQKTSPTTNAGIKQLKPAALGSGFFGIL